MNRKGFLATFMGLAASPFLSFPLFSGKKRVRPEHKVWIMDNGDFIDGPIHSKEWRFKEIYF